MTFGAAYATASEYRSNGNPSNANDTEIGRDLLAVSQMLNQLLGKPLGFNASSAGLARVYVTPTLRLYDDFAAVLDIDDVVTVTAVEVDDGKSGSYTLTLTTDDYELLPRGVADLPVAKPYSQIALTSWGALPSWPSRVRVRVTGTWGWPAVPDAIKRATITLTSLLRAESPFATDRVTELNQIVRTSPQARKVIQQLMDAYAAPVSFGVGI